MPLTKDIFPRYVQGTRARHSFPCSAVEQLLSGSWLARMVKHSSVSLRFAKLNFVSRCKVNCLGHSYIRVAEEFLQFMACRISLIVFSFLL